MCGLKNLHVPGKIFLSNTQFFDMYFLYGCYPKLKLD